MGRKGWGTATGENPEIALLRAGRPLFPRAALTRGLACGFPTLRPPLVRKQVPRLSVFPAGAQSPAVHTT